jgi:hypothetical protein
MVQFILIFLVVIALGFTFIAVHESGHYLAGLTAGIPAKVMRIRLFTFPQHVALRDGDEWLSPVANIERYIDVSRRYLCTRAAAFRWVAGGMVVGTVFTVLVYSAAFIFGSTLLALWVATLSLAMYLVNVLVMDLPWALLRGHPCGDTSGMWMIAKVPAVLLAIVLVVVDAFLVWLAW